MSSFLQGTGVALVTPFNKEGAVDYEGLTALITNCIEGDVAYIVVLGTTAESVTLSKEEKHKVAAHIVAVVDKRLPLVIGVGGNNTASIIEELQTINTSDYAAVLSVVPMYNKPTQEGIYQHYKMLNDQSPLPILLYNVPSRTGVNMQASTTIRLAALDNVIGIKEATSDFSQILTLLKETPDDFLVISGDDELALSTVLAGGDGVISVVGQGFPEAFSKMINLGLAGQSRVAFDILYDLLPAIGYAFEEGNPAGIKSILAEQGVCEPVVRLPLVAASKELTQKIKTFVANR